MRGIWEALRDAAQPVLGPDEVAAAPARPRPAEGDRGGHATSSACLSIPTLDEKAWRATEPHTPHPRARLEAVAELNRDGHPDRHPDRAADAGDQRRARAGERRSSKPRRRRRRPTSAATRCSCAARTQAVFEWLQRAPAGAAPALRAAVRERARVPRADGPAPRGARGRRAVDRQGRVAVRPDRRFRPLPPRVRPPPAPPTRLVTGHRAGLVVLTVMAHTETETVPTPARVG